MTDINVGQFSEALNNKMDRDGHNVQTPSDVVIAHQMPTAQNNYTWYRKYASGWVEQGGVTSTDGTQNLPVEMADTNYTALRTNGNGRVGTGANELYTSIMQKTTTSIYLALDANIAPVSWQVSGVAA